MVRYEDNCQLGSTTIDVGLLPVARVAGRIGASRSGVHIDGVGGNIVRAGIRNVESTH